MNIKVINLVMCFRKELDMVLHKTDQIVEKSKEELKEPFKTKVGKCWEMFIWFHDAKIR